MLVTFATTISDLELEIYSPLRMTGDIQEGILTQLPSTSVTPRSPRERHRERHLGWEQSELASRGRYARTLGELSAQFPMLTMAELRVCALLKNVLSPAMIAELLGVRVKTVENHKRNIRRKLGLSPGASIQDYLLGVSSEVERKK